MNNNEEEAQVANEVDTQSPPPMAIEPEWLLDYPREALEREFYQQDGYWSRILSLEDRSLILDYIRLIAFNLAWQLYSEDSASMIPDELKKPISLQVLLEYCAGTFKKLTQAVNLIAKSPNQKISIERKFTDFNLARGKSERTLSWLASHPDIQNFEQAAPEVKIAPNLRRIFSKVAPSGEQISYLPREVPEFWPAVDYNTYENSFVRHFLDTMRKDLDIIAILAQEQEAGEIRLQAEALKLQVRELEQYDFLKQASLLLQLRKATVVMQKQPHYRRVYEIYRYYHRVFAFDWANPLFELPLRQTWLLYEYWCLFQVIATLGELGFHPVKNKTDFFYADIEKKIYLDLPKGRASRLQLRRRADDLNLEIYYSRQFPDEEEQTDQEMAFTHPMNPGILLVSPEAAFILDIKFKAYASEGGWYDDMDKLHAYRGALSVNGRAVKRAWCLYPGPVSLEKTPQGFAVTSQALASLQDVVGLLRLHPSAEGSNKALRFLLSYWLPTKQGYFPSILNSPTASPSPGEAPIDRIQPGQPEPAANPEQVPPLPVPEMGPDPSYPGNLLQDERPLASYQRRRAEGLETPQQFQKRARQVISSRWGIRLRKGQVGIQGVSQVFGLVSRGGKKLVGTALQYSEEASGSSATGQAARVAACVWLLQNMEGVPHRFIVFGNPRDDFSIATKWLANYKPLTLGLEFYFLDSRDNLHQWAQGSWQ